MKCNLFRAGFGAALESENRLARTYRLTARAGVAVTRRPQTYPPDSAPVLGRDVRVLVGDGRVAARAGLPIHDTSRFGAYLAYLAYLVNLVTQASDA